MQDDPWDCPETDLETTDAIYVRMRLRTSGWKFQYFITEQLGADVLNASTWTFYRYIWRNYPDPGEGWTTGKCFYDTETFDTRITGFQWTPPPVAPTVTTQAVSNIGTTTSTP